MAGKVASFGLILSLCSSSSAVSPPSVTVDAGTINGGLCGDDLDAKFFKSIAYAQPPLGSVRFQPPQPYTGKYSNVYSTAAPACIQFGNLSWRIHCILRIGESSSKC
jgi:carboxylesterase type B